MRTSGSGVLSEANLLTIYVALANLPYVSLHHNGQQTTGLCHPSGVIKATSRLEKLVPVFFPWPKLGLRNEPHRRERTLGMTGKGTPVHRELPSSSWSFVQNVCGVVQVKDQKAARLSFTYSFPCPGCRELIALPPQSRLGWAGTSQFLHTAVWPITFLCNRHSSIAEIPASAIHLSTDSLNGKMYGVDTLLAIEGDCGLENCGKRHTIYTHCPSNTDSNLIIRGFLSLNPNVACLGGHPAKFQRDRLGVSRLLGS